MNIWSKKLLISGSKRYKAYILISGRYIDVAKLGFTENINPDKTFGASDETVPGYYVILNGKLYDYTTGFIRVGTRTDWTAISGQGSSANDCAYGIAGGDLYQVYRDSNGYIVNRMTYSYTDFKKVCGYFKNTQSESINAFAIGTNNNTLFKLNGSSITRIDDNWVDIRGFYSKQASYNMLGLTSDGRLRTSKNEIYYYLHSANDWTAISGYLPSSYGYAYSIRSGILYSICDTTVGQIGTRNDWTAISGFSVSPNSNTSERSYAYGIAGGELYSLYCTGVYKLHPKSDWNIVSQCRYNSSGITGYGIRNGFLYKFADKTVTLVGLSNCVKLMTSSQQGLVVVEEPVTIVSYTEQSWTRPNLTANGTLGGDSFAVDATADSDKYLAYKAVDGNDNTYYYKSNISRNVKFTIYNPVPLKISKMSFKYSPNNMYPLSNVGLAGSVDGIEYTTITSSYVYSSSILTVTNPTAYNYYKMVLTPWSNRYPIIGIADLSITATEVIEP